MIRFVKESNYLKYSVALFARHIGGFSLHMENTQTCTHHASVTAPCRCRTLCKHLSEAAVAKLRFASNGDGLQAEKQAAI